MAPGAVYDPDPSLPQVNGHTGAHYVQVLHESGRVLTYDYIFHSQPVSQAKADVLSTQLPPDAHPLWFVARDTCAFMLVQSNKLARSLGTKAIGDASGTILVEFVSGADSSGANVPYSPTGVVDALFTVSPKTSPPDASSC